MAYSFDGATKTINLTSGTVVLDVKDLWSRYVEWLETGSNSRWQIAMSQIGGNDIDITSGTKVPIYIYLTNSWKIKPQEVNHTLNVTSGVLLVDGGGDPFIDTLGAYTVRINYAQPVQAITVSTGGGGDPAVIADAIWDELKTSHTTANTFGKIIQDMEVLTKQIKSLTAAQL